jgi:hypothetical protein
LTKSESFSSGGRNVTAGTGVSQIICFPLGRWRVSKSPPITNNVRRRRFAHGEMTLGGVAERIGKARQTIAAIELGK